MAGHIHAKPPKRERTIDGTTYIVTSHFKQTGSTVADHIRRLIDTATKTAYAVFNLTSRKLLLRE
mgnify:CR=1 FL=1